MSTTSSACTFVANPLKLFRSCIPVPPPEPSASLFDRVYDVSRPWAVILATVAGCAFVAKAVAMWFGHDRSTAQSTAVPGDEPALLRRLAQLMRRVAALFTIHALGHLTSAWRSVYLEGASALPGLGDCADELAYAVFIRSASLAFEAAAAKGAASREAPSLLGALEVLCELWSKMAMPLAIKSAILYGQFLHYWVRVVMERL